MKTEQELKNNFLANINIYEAWGKFILTYIKNEAEKRGIILRFPPSIRIKEVESFIEKALYRNKKYNDPFEEIEDKVGVRFYVLLEQEIKQIGKIIESSTLWNFSKDRDYFQEMIDSPLDFDYKSVHYVLRNKKEFVYLDQKIPINTPCEIQIRTLLQHAHSELMHDTVYKSNINVNSEIRRIIAKSCVLIEIADNFFEVANNEISKISSNLNNYYENLLKLFISNFQIDNKRINKRINIKIIKLIIESPIGKIKINDLDNFVKNYKDIIKENINQENILSYQPIIILLYYCAKQYSSQLRYIWKYDEAFLENLFITLGISFN